MLLFIAGQTFPVSGDFRVAKIAVFAASVLPSVIGVGMLWVRRNPIKVEGKGCGQALVGIACR